MISHRAQRLFNEVEIDGKFNFSMKKSEYIPILTTFDSIEHLIYTHNLFLSSSCCDSININKYLNFKFTSYYNRRYPFSDYLSPKKEFIEKVLRLDDLVFHLRSNIAFPNVKYLTKFSYHKAFNGTPFRVDNIEFRGIAKTLIYYKQKDKLGFLYVFTFKTKYIKELQKALISGRNVKSEWFTVFIEKDFPLVTNSRGYSKAFKDRFITPFEKKNIEIVYTDKILEKLSYTQIDRSVWSPKAKKREDKKKEMEAVLLSFLAHEKQEIKEKKEIEIGLNSQIIYNAWLKRRSAFITLYNFIEYVDKTYYKGIELVEGMQRLLKIGANGRSIKQTYFEGQWITEEIVQIPNALLVVFSTLKELEEESIETPISNFDDCIVIIESKLTNSSLSTYVEYWESPTIDSNIVYEIKNFKAIKHKLNEKYPDKVWDDKTKGYVFYDNKLNGYLTTLSLCEITYVENLFEDTNILLITFSELLNNRKKADKYDLVYIWDIHVLFIVYNTLLFKAKIDSIYDKVEIIKEHILKGEVLSDSPISLEKVIKHIENMPNPLLFSGQDVALSTYYNFTEKEVLHYEN